MAQKWYWMKDGKERGPFDIAGIKELAKSGELKSADLLWQEGVRHKWFPAMEVNELFPAPAFPIPAAGDSVDVEKKTDLSRPPLSTDAADVAMRKCPVSAERIPMNSRKCRSCNFVMGKAPKWVIPLCVNVLRNTACRPPSEL